MIRALAILALSCGCTKDTGKRQTAQQEAGDAAVATIDASAGAARARRAGPVDHSTSAATRDGTLIVRGITKTRRHTHGGEPAKISSVQFEVTNKSSGARGLALEQVESIRARGCPRGPWGKGTPVAHVGLRLESDRTDRSYRSVIEVPPGIHRVDVGFEVVNAYQSWCNLFGFRARFAGDGERLAAVAEARVVRVTPLRR